MSPQSQSMQQPLIPLDSPSKRGAEIEKAVPWNRSPMTDDCTRFRVSNFVVVSRSCVEP